MKEYLVLYGPDYELFYCFAEDVEHAKEQCLDAYPDEDIMRIFVRVDE